MAIKINTREPELKIRRNDLRSCIPQRCQPGCDANIKNSHEHHCPRELLEMCTLN